jgi:FkbM family methyltransferase
MIPDEVSFFTKYRITKILKRPLSDYHMFWKLFFRSRRRMPGTVSVLMNNEMLFQIKKPSAQTPLGAYIRMVGSSDMKVFYQIFREQQYKPLIRMIQKARQQSHIHFMIDAGANAGFTSVYLKNFFPHSQLVALEPDESNARQILKNYELNHLENYYLEQAGLWSRSEWLQVYRDGKEEQAFYVKPTETPTGLMGISLESLMKKYNQPVIDILKIDIEGSEKELFADVESIKKILHCVRFIAMEIHDDMADRKHIYNVLQSCQFTWIDVGELTIARNERLV